MTCMGLYYVSADVSADVTEVIWIIGYPGADRHRVTGHQRWQREPGEVDHDDNRYVCHITPSEPST